MPYTGSVGCAKIVPVCTGGRETASPWFQPLILTNGDVWPCCWFFKRDAFDQIINGSEFKNAAPAPAPALLGRLLRRRRSVTAQVGWWHGAIDGETLAVTP
jgi:hypothetical protein